MHMSLYLENKESVRILTFLWQLEQIYTLEATQKIRKEGIGSVFPAFRRREISKEFGLLFQS